MAQNGPYWPHSHRVTELQSDRHPRVLSIGVCDFNKLPYSLRSQGKQGCFLYKYYQKNKALVTKPERSLIFSSLKKSFFFKLLLLVNFLFQWFSYILNLLNILMILNKSIIQCYWVNVITSSQKYWQNRLKICNWYLEHDELDLQCLTNLQ